jgi:elongation factor P
MIKATDLKGGTTFLHFGRPYQVLKYNLIKLGRGSAYVKIAAKNLKTGSLEEISFQSNATVEEAETAKKKLQFLYCDATSAVFVDPKTFDQVQILLTRLGHQVSFLKEGEEVNVLFSADEALSLELPPKVVFRVAQADPGVRGNSATNIYKPAFLENGLKIKVPLFIKVGDRVRIDTRSGAYVERVK